MNFSLSIFTTAPLLSELVIMIPLRFSRCSITSCFLFDRLCINVFVFSTFYFIYIIFYKATKWVNSTIIFFRYPFVFVFCFKKFNAKIQFWWRKKRCGSFSSWFWLYFFDIGILWCKYLRKNNASISISSIFKWAFNFLLYIDSVSIVCWI